jgi:hypothetical protein
VQAMSIEDLRAQYTQESDGTVGINQGSYAFSTYTIPNGHSVTLIDHYSIHPTEASKYPRISYRTNRY